MASEDFPGTSLSSAGAAASGSSAPVIVPAEEKALIKKARLLLHKEFRIGITDGRVFVGKFHCLDKQGNILLADTVEYRPMGRSRVNIVGGSGKEEDGGGEELRVDGRQPRPPHSEQRNLGLVLIPAKEQVSIRLVSRMEDKMALLSLKT